MPEIEATASTSIYRDMKFRLGDNEQEVVMATADSVFMNFFNIQLLKGTVNFLKENDPEIAITEEFARKLFGSEEDALGKEVELSGRLRKIGAIVSGWSRHSNIPYSVLSSARRYPRWSSKENNCLSVFAQVWIGILFKRRWKILISWIFPKRANL